MIKISINETALAAIERKTLPGAMMIPPRVDLDQIGNFLIDIDSGVLKRLESIRRKAGIDTYSHAIIRLVQADDLIADAKPIYRKAWSRDWPHDDRYCLELALECDSVEELVMLMRENHEF